MPIVTVFVEHRHSTLHTLGRPRCPKDGEIEEVNIPLVSEQLFAFGGFRCVHQPDVEMPQVSGLIVKELD